MNIPHVVSILESNYSIDFDKSSHDAAGSKLSEIVNKEKETKPFMNITLKDRAPNLAVLENKNLALTASEYNCDNRTFDTAGENTPEAEAKGKEIKTP